MQLLNHFFLTRSLFVWETCCYLFASYSHSLIFTADQRFCQKVMFSVLSVILASRAWPLPGFVQTFSPISIGEILNQGPLKPVFYKSVYHHFTITTILTFPRLYVLKYSLWILITNLSMQNVISNNFSSMNIV